MDREIGSERGLGEVAPPALAGVRRVEGTEDVPLDQIPVGVTLCAADDEQLDWVAPTDLHWGAPLTVQFFVEHHPIAHPYMHLESIRAALGSGE